MCQTRHAADEQAKQTGPEDIVHVASLVGVQIADRLEDVICFIFAAAIKIVVMKQIIRAVPCGESGCRDLYVAVARLESQALELGVAEEIGKLPQLNAASMEAVG